MRVMGFHSFLGRGVVIFSAERVRVYSVGEQWMGGKTQKKVSFFEKMLHGGDKLFTLAALNFFPNN